MDTRVCVAGSATVWVAGTETVCAAAGTARAQSSMAAREPLQRHRPARRKPARTREAGRSSLREGEAGRRSPRRQGAKGSGGEADSPKWPLHEDPSSGLGSARLGSARLGSARLGSARLGSARFGSVRFGSDRIVSAARETHVNGKRPGDPLKSACGTPPRVRDPGSQARNVIQPPLDGEGDNASDQIRDPRLASDRGQA